MTRVGFESTIPAFERAKTVHALDRADTVIGLTEHKLVTIIRLNNNNNNINSNLATEVEKDTRKRNTANY
jgi:hypothetical protein